MSKEDPDLCEAIRDLLADESIEGPVADSIVRLWYENPLAPRLVNSLPRAEYPDAVTKTASVRSHSMVMCAFRLRGRHFSSEHEES